MTSTPVPSTRNAVPTTLRNWKSSGWESESTVPRDVWTPLEQFFLEQGLTLWKKSETCFHLLLIPHNGLLRSPDGFVYTTPLNDVRDRDNFYLVVWFFPAIMTS